MYPELVTLAVVLASIVVATLALAVAVINSLKLDEDDDKYASKMLARGFEHPLSVCRSELSRHITDRLNMPEQGPLYVALMDVLAWICNCREEESKTELVHQLSMIQLIGQKLYVPADVGRTLDKACDLLQQRLDYLTENGEDA